MEFEFRRDREEHLRKLCAELGRSVDDFVNEAVLTFMEDYEDSRDAQKSLAEGGRLWTQAEMEREFALDSGVPERHCKTA